ncbi:hypothetical protein RFEPED_1156 [Rickettsia felis str. Pedreira]|uniref:Uncharacterized protein n=1 Tax=Rickettsia felis str. Pedreira TaxID=1359196 RepID=A0A0F3MSJ8_RICFI|nr:hypothetical protein [Rickettsia felis]KHO02268.1 hypothetical protein JS55_06930 [Rickettsia felis str. LSU]KHO02600.1 hypothetical protein JS61_06670 [Rickettsia felis]KJV58763.1 hypothetical protein RFEPED_1156 [Rickettsia felis str. Pedreira]MDE8611595.1 hypothetical protein [Rickettsia felis]
MSKQSNDMETLAALQRIKAKATTLSKEIKSKPITSMVTTGTPHLTVDQTSNQMNNDYEDQQTKLAGKSAKKGGCEIM